MAAPIDFGAVKRLTNLNDIVRALHETHARERSIEGELEQLLSKRSDIERSFLRLHSTASEVMEQAALALQGPLQRSDAAAMHLQVLVGLLADAEQLASSVHSTSELSERVSFKVRELDTAQSRINDTLQRISLVVDRSAAVAGIRAALEAGDYEAAAEHVSKYLGLEQRFGPITDELDSRQLQEQQRVGLPLMHTDSMQGAFGVSARRRCMPACTAAHACHGDACQLAQLAGGACRDDRVCCGGRWWRMPRCACAATS